MFSAAHVSPNRLVPNKGCKIRKKKMFNTIILFQKAVLQLVAYIVPFELPSEE